MRDFLGAGELILVTLAALASVRQLDERVLPRGMRIVALDARSQLEGRVRNCRRLRCLTDVVVALEAQRGVPILDDLVERSLMAGVTAVEYRSVEVGGEQLRVVGAVRRMAGGALERRWSGS